MTFTHCFLQLYCFVDIIIFVHVAKPIAAVTEFVAQLQILELLENVCMAFIFSFPSFLIEDSFCANCICLNFSWWISHKFYNLYILLCVRQFLQPATRLSCTFTLLLRNVRLLSCYSKLTRRRRNPWKKKFSSSRMVLLLYAVFRFVSQSE